MTELPYLSVCSGIEATSLAWEPLGFRPVAFSEIEPFTSAVLAHHWPNIENLGDMTKYHEWEKRIDTQPRILVGGTPCQSFSISGLRRGLRDARGNLTLTFLGLLETFRPRWVVWENVRGVLSDETNAFGCLLAGLEECGYEWCYRVLDAQYFGVAQRRARCFVVGCARETGFHPFPVLFDPQSLCGDLAPSREAWKETASCLTQGYGARRGGAGQVDAAAGNQLVPYTVSEEGEFQEYGPDGIPLVANTLTARMEKGINSNIAEGQTPIPVPIAFSCKDCGEDAGPVSPPLRAMNNAQSKKNGGGQVAIAFERRIARNDRGQPQEELAHCLKSESNTGDGAQCVAIQNATRVEGQNGVGVTDDADVMYTLDVASQHAVAYGIDQEQNVDEELFGCLTARTGCGFEGAVGLPDDGKTYVVRRLTPRECERLMGMPDDHTRIKWLGKPLSRCPDGHRYKAIGNSIAVPVLDWIGRRLAAADAIIGS